MPSLQVLVLSCWACLSALRPRCSPFLKKGTRLTKHSCVLHLGWEMFSSQRAVFRLKSKDYNSEARGSKALLALLSPWEPCCAKRGSWFAFASCHPTQSWLVQAPHGSRMCILSAPTFFFGLVTIMQGFFLLFTPGLHKLSLLPVTAEKNCRLSSLNSPSPVGVCCPFFIFNGGFYSWCFS